MDASVSPPPRQPQSTHPEPVEDLHVEQWLREAREGSIAALGQALEAGRKYLLLIANRALNNELKAKVGASDVVQNTYVEAQRGFAQFRGTTEREFYGWLLGILNNRIANTVRHYRHTERRAVGREVAGGALEGAAESLRDPAATPGTEFFAQEERRRVSLALERLDEPWRSILIERTWEGAGFKEIGQRHNCSAEAARKIWTRAVQRLEKILASIE